MAMRGEVVKLDRGFPLIRLEDGTQLRAEHAVSLVKGGGERAVVGDEVMVDVPEEHDKAIIVEILPRWRTFTRKDPTERALPQVLAANFDQVIVAQPINDVNLRRLERELVLAFETGAQVAVVLTKADLAANFQQMTETEQQVRALVGPEVPVLVMSAQDGASVEAVRALMEPDTMTILIGRSGVGKSSLVNLLAGSQLQQTQEVREADGKGRHTTVSRQIVPLPNGARVVDMPGVRGLGLWEAEEGLDAAFSDIAALAEQCRFRDCRHQNEPGCAVRAAVESGQLSPQRFASYQALVQETHALKQRREEARWTQKEQPPVRKHPHSAKRSNLKKRGGKR